MAERTFSAISAHQPTTTAVPGKITLTASTQQILQQIHAPQDGPPLRIIEWGITFDGSAAATGVQVELLETNDGQTMANSYVVPYGYLNTAIAASGTTTLVPYPTASGGTTTTQFPP